MHGAFRPSRPWRHQGQGIKTVINDNSYVRYEEKITNGKLVCIELWEDSGLVSRAKISGDFFLHPEDSITAIEDSLRGIPVASDEQTVAKIISDSLRTEGAQLIGVTAEDLGRLFRKAVG